MNAIGEMVKYYNEGSDMLRDELLCFLTLLNRARPQPDEEMDEVLRRIRIHDPFLESDPWDQEYGGRQRTEGEARGEVKGIRETLQGFIEVNYPRLVELARERIPYLEDATFLLQFFLSICSLREEEQVKRALQQLPQIHS